MRRKAGRRCAADGGRTACELRREWHTLDILFVSVRERGTSACCIISSRSFLHRWGVFFLVLFPRDPIHRLPETYYYPSRRSETLEERFPPFRSAWRTIHREDVSVAQFASRHHWCVCAALTSIDDQGEEGVAAVFL